MRDLQQRLMPLLVLGSMAAPFPVAIAILWAVVHRDWWLFVAIYGTWLGAGILLYPLWRDYRTKEAT